METEKKTTFNIVDNDNYPMGIYNIIGKIEKLIKPIKVDSKGKFISILLKLHDNLRSLVYSNTKGDQLPGESHLALSISLRFTIKDDTGIDICCSSLNGFDSYIFLNNSKIGEPYIYEDFEAHSNHENLGTELGKLKLPKMIYVSNIIFTSKYNGTEFSFHHKI